MEQKTIFEQRNKLFTLLLFMKKLLALLLFFISVVSYAQGLQTPGEFLGYTFGSRFVSHYQVVNYFEYVARTRPKQVKLVRYGTTSEGRPLIAAIVAKEEFMNEIEEIRQNNLKSIGVLSGTPTKKQPAICYLSYTVHGNETAGTSASMPVLHDLLDPNNATSKSILENTVVILDPCLNPDGYDRYVNWNMQKVGRTFNPNPNAWEHNEPWPGGRFNHYLYDMNRDWAWQTQVESQAKVKFYNSWMPHLHADLHEQGVNSPYYFPPSAKPYHEDITAWQREFQQTIGEYQRKYFDKNNWLYFTREAFDLFYPSYGDTYPTYNGAIGYTLEQGGSGRAGLGITTDEGDTLTIKQRYEHHYASSFAAMEAISSRAEKTVNEFIKYFENGKNNPVGNFKAYVIKTKGEEVKVKPFLDFLDKQGFVYGYAGKEATMNGYSFQDDKFVPTKVEAEDVVINMYQPRSTYLKILLEPKSVLEDSVTYDITSWSLPYAYGLKAFGMKDKMVVAAKPAEAAQNKPAIEKPYAYVAHWKTFEDAKFLAHLINKKIRVRAAEKPFEIGGEKFESGSLIITRTGNEKLGTKLDEIVQEESKDHGIVVYPVASGFVTKGSDFGSGNVNYLKAPKVAILSGEGISPTGFGDVWHYFDQVLRYPSTVINANDLGFADLKQFDVLIMPGGSYGRALNEGTMNSLKNWVRSGGRLIALESANASLAGKPDFALKNKEAASDDKKKDAKSDSVTLRVYEKRERESVSEETPGSIYKISLDNSHPLAFGYDKFYHALVLEATDYAYLKDGWNVGYTKKNDWVTGFAGKKAKEKLANSLMLGVQDMGRGKVVYMINNPLFRGFWYNGKLLFANAVFMVN